MSDAPESVSPSAAGSRTPKRWLLALVAALIFVVGFGLGGLLQPVATAPADQGAADKGAWTCSMHPQIKLPGPGACPLCSMDLIRVASDGGDGKAELVMSEAGARLAEVETVAVKRGVAEAELKFVGKVEYDETRVKTIAAWTPGRLDRLYVDYTGVAVRKGDHLVTLYSPDLISAQEELLQAIRAVDELRASNSDLVLSTARATVQAAREKLRLLGLREKQVQAIEDGRKVEDRVTIYAPEGGIVIHKNAVEGMYVQTGSPIYKIADLSYVWVYLEAYESDLAWLRYGQTVNFETEAYPGELFRGRISFIDPVLDTRTRTVKVRVNAPNADGRLKPGMFVRASVFARMVRDGQVLESSLAGKWISPMHPEIVKDEPGACDVCGMDLVRAETLGLAGPKQPLGPPLLIPRSAVLYTGKRSVVYVKKPGAKTPTYLGRVVTLGPQAGDEVIVKAGLEEGEEVVVRGAFKIDSALQILARPSMMNRATSEGEHSDHADHGAPTRGIKGALRGALRAELAPALARYLEVQRALAGDQVAAAAGSARELRAALMPLAGHADAPAQWSRLVQTMVEQAARLADAGELKEQRAAFASLTADVLLALELGAPRALDKVSCPMAFGGLGGTWLQAPGSIANPYFGASMLRCGEVVEAIPARRGS